MVWQSIGEDSVYHLVEEPDYSERSARLKPLCGLEQERALSFKPNGAAYCRHCMGLEVKV